ncbi:hypothetical protein RATSFB_0101 [Candidatus Arthromitus sp. SFB-rat-Yit]|nr:hypothetical protein RATSFB_0101 [Candidatus Arthromitus sp. SFB-rat-Yit]
MKPNNIKSSPIYIGLLISIPSSDNIFARSSSDKSFILSLSLFSLNILPLTLKNLFISTLYFDTQPKISSLVGVFEIRDLKSTSILFLTSQSLAFLTLVHLE